MSLTNPAVLLNTTFSNKNISSAASVYDYTVTANGKINIAVKLTNAAGNGDYIIYLKRQWLGTGTASTILGKTTFTAASGETVIEFQTMMATVFATDVISVFIDGLAGDTAVNGNIQIVQDNYSLFDSTVDAIINTTLTRLATMLQLDGAVYQYTANALELGPSATATVAISATQAASVASGNLAITAYATFSQAITSTSTLSLPGTKLWLAIKSSLSDTDAQSIVFIERTAGLQYLNGAAYTGSATDGAIAVTGSSGAYTITATLQEVATALLTGLDNRYLYELKALVSGDTYILSSGYCDITTGIVRAIA